MGAGVPHHPLRPQPQAAGSQGPAEEQQFQEHRLAGAPGSAAGGSPDVGHGVLRKPPGVRGPQGSLRGGPPPERGHVRDG